MGGQSDEQARAQFTMWSLFPANLLISQNVLQWSDYALTTYSNQELVAINQDPLGSPAQRITGSDLQFPCAGGGGGGTTPGAVASVVAAPCNATDPYQQWKYDATTGYITATMVPDAVLDDFGCGSSDGNPVALFHRDEGTTALASPTNCGGKNQHWSHNANGTITNNYNGICLDVFDFLGPTVDVWECNGGANQNFTLTAWGGIATGGMKAAPLAGVEPGVSGIVLFSPAGRLRGDRLVRLEG